MKQFALLQFKINKFYWKNKAFIYPNSIILTEDQLYSFYPSLTKEDREYVKINSLSGLKVILTDYIEEPRLLRL